MNTVKITLDYPVKITGKETSEITMRRPKVRDMILSDRPGKSDAEKEMSLFSDLTGMSPDELQELDMGDYLKLQEAYRGFLSSRPATPVKPA